MIKRIGVAAGCNGYVWSCPTSLSERIFLTFKHYLVGPPAQKAVEFYGEDFYFASSYDGGDISSTGTQRRGDNSGMQHKIVFSLVCMFPPYIQGSKLCFLSMKDSI